MRETAIFVLKKYVVEVMVAAAMLALWPVFLGSPLFGLKTEVIGSLLVVLLGTVMTGYLLFICISGAALYYFVHENRLRFIAICFLCIFFVLTYYSIGPKNQITTPVALGILFVNTGFLIGIFISKQKN